MQFCRTCLRIIASEPFSFRTDRENTDQVSQHQHTDRGQRDPLKPKYRSRLLPLVLSLIDRSNPVLAVRRRRRRRESSRHRLRDQSNRTREHYYRNETCRWPALVGSDADARTLLILFMCVTLRTTRIHL